MKEIREFLLCLAAMLAPNAFADAPAGYYSSCEGYNGAELLKKLESVISDHTQVGYDGLWALYKTSDAYADGSIWDMYSTKHWTYQKEQCGTYLAVGDCYNREHSMPKSWFDKALPMYCDAFHIYPTDGKVNGERSNYPYGECASGTTSPSSGSVKALGKLGACTFPGYSGTVFEPDDQYKGDFARSYFYMAACYNSQIKSWDSDMLAGNSYPAFTSWAVNLLLKWHRQDPVSQKEIDRNDAVYAKQKNRNPFIDHPELAEYIWGDKTTQNWSAYGEAEAALVLPVDDSSYDFGYLHISGEKTIVLTVKGTNLTAPVTLSTDVDGISANRSSISASDANKPDGVSVNITWNPEDIGAMSGVVVFTSGSCKSTVNISGTAVDELKANAARNISDRSFVASWTYAGDEFADGTYQICVTDGDGDVITTKAKAAECECSVDGLVPNTSYTYCVKSQSMTSNAVSFSTGDPIPYIQLLYDGQLFLESTPGQPSEAYEIWVDAENINTNILVAVSEPFSISTDKADWSTSISLAPDEDRFFMRLFSDQTGSYSTIIKLTAGTYVNDDITIYGSVAESKGFFEDFEADATGCDTYNGCEYRGSAATWQLDNAGIWATDKNDALSGVQCVRMGKKADSAITMLGNKTRGIGTVAIHAKRWSASDGDCTFHVEYSTDNGETWEATSDAVVSSDDYQTFTFTINVTADARIKVAQTVGVRFIIDDIEITDNAAGIADVDHSYRSWNAYCRKGALVVESEGSQQAVIFGADGIIRFRGEVNGTSEFVFAPGLYVVAIDGFSRTVIVK